MIGNPNNFRRLSFVAAQAAASNRNQRIANTLAQRLARQLMADDARRVQIDQDLLDIRSNPR